MSYAVALDIGGTKIEGVLFNDKYKQLKKIREYFKKKKSWSVVRMSKKEVLAIICNLITELKAGVQIKCIGISIPDVITKDGSISGTSKIGALSNFALGKYLKRKFKCKVKIANDADCFALGEQKLGAGKGYCNIIGIIYGTGIGSGIILDGKIYSGTTGSAGEFGHNVIDPNGPKERIGLKGTVEAFAAGPNLVRNYIVAGGKIKDPNPRKIFYSKESIARKVMDLSLDRFAIGLASLINILNPGIIVIGGGLSNLPVYKQLNSLTKKYTIDGLRKRVKIVKNKLGDSAGIYGAASLVFD